MKKNDLKNALKREAPFFMIMPALIWQVLFFFVPFFIILGLSFVTFYGPVIGQIVTFNYYLSLCDNAHVRIVARSLIFAVLNAIFCLICAYPVAYFLARRITRWKNFFLFFLILPFWTNMLIQIHAWFFILERNGLINTILLKLGIITTPLHLANNIGSVFLLMVYCYMPFMIMPLYSILEKLDQRLIESSYDLGANNWQTFFNVTLPLSLPGIKTGLFLVFVPSFGEFVIPALMGGSKHMFVGSLISHYFLMAFDVQKGAAFTIASGLVLLLVFVLCNWFFSKKMRTTKGPSYAAFTPESLPSDVNSGE